MRFSILFLFLALFGCTAEGFVPEDKAAYQPEDASTEDDAADYFSRRTTVLGVLNKNNGFSEVDEFKSDTYAGFLFTGSAGDEVTLNASSDNGDTVVVLYGPQRGSGFSRARALTWNDDAPGQGTDSELSYELRRDGTYLVVVLEYYGRSGSLFHVGVSGLGNSFCDPAGSDCPTGSECVLPTCGPTERCAPVCEPIDPALACDTDTDCQLINPGCCCFDQIAVNASYADARTPSCEEPTICPAFCRSPEALEATCVANRCEAIAVEPTPPCRPSGCSGQVCSDEDVITTCEFRPEYACYAAAACERQDDGECGWTETPELTECLEGPADCRTEDCGEGSYCSFCWGTFQCIPEGAVC